MAPSEAHWLLAQGATLCLGSDSQIQIDLLEYARLLEYHLRSATTRTGSAGSATSRAGTSEPDTV